MPGRQNAARILALTKNSGGPRMSHETIVLIVAIVASIIGVGTFFHYFLMVAGWPRAAGKVIGNTSRFSSHDSGTSYSFFPIIEFRAADEKTYEVMGDVGKQKEWPVGTVVPLQYRPANPNHTTIAKGWQRCLFSLFFLAGAVVTWHVYFDKYW